MTMFTFKTVGFDSTALFNIIPTPPTETEPRYGMRLVSNSFSDKTATLFFPSEEDRDQGIYDFIEQLNAARAA